jgi:type IV pilus assembly protein PilE
MRKRMQGFSLMELLIVVVVIGILASIAVPSYRRYVMRTHRTDATAALLRIQSAQEKFFLQNNQYAGDLIAAPPAGLGMVNVTEGGKYTLNIVPGGGPPVMAYRAIATPAGGQQQDTRCQSFSINEIGVRAATDGGGADTSRECWGRR